MASSSGGSQFLSKTSSSSSGFWSRPGLNKPHTLYPVSQPKLEPLPAVGGGLGTTRQDSLGQEGSHKISQLEKNIAFLKSQHEQTLSKLHQEIERLMEENRDLNFKVVMTQSGSGPYSKTCCKRHDGQQEDDPDELRSIMLEEEARQLRNSLINEKNRNARLMKVIEQRRPKSNEPSDGESSVRSSAGSKQLQSRLNGCHSRPPTLAECESIIKHLQQTNDRQSHELLQIKADLKDVLYSHKWTPDAYLIAKAYVDNDDRPDLSTIPFNKSSV